MQILSFDGKKPQLKEGVFIAPGVVITGDVLLETHVNIWFNCVIRGDINPVRIGAGTNIQDGSILHVGTQHATTVGERVVAGHGVQIHGSTVEDQCLIGMGAILLNGSKIGTGAIVAAGAVVPEGMYVPSRHLVAGVPAKIIRQVSDAEFDQIAKQAEHYCELAEKYRASLLLSNDHSTGL